MKKGTFVVRSSILARCAVLSALLGSAACGGESTGAEAELELGSQDLAASEWINGWSALSFGDGSSVNVEGQAMACEFRYGGPSPGGQAIFKKDASNRIAMAAAGIGGAWWVYVRQPGTAQR